MSRLFVRNRNCGYVIFIHDKQELIDFINNYIPGRHLVIGDVAQFNKPMRQMLLKLLEENPQLDCFSTSDLVDPIIQSRFIEIIKDPIRYEVQHNVENYLNSDRSHQSAKIFLSGLNSSFQLRVPLCNRQVLKLILKNG